jgi:hypothetical protein
VDEEGTSHLGDRPMMAVLVVVAVACKEDRHLLKGGKEAHAQTHPILEVGVPGDIEGRADNRKEAKVVDHRSSQEVALDCRPYKCSDAGR